MIRQINTPKELYEYCKEFNAEDWKIIIREHLKMETPNLEGVYIVTNKKEVLIVI